jgi:hypothetical protein
MPSNSLFNNILENRVFGSNLGRYTENPQSLCKFQDSTQTETTNAITTAFNQSPETFWSPQYPIHLGYF